MEPVGAPPLSDVHNQSHRQSILGSFLRVRPRGASQSHQGPLNINTDHHEQAVADAPAVNMPIQPPSPSPGHRRRPAAGGLQPSISATHGFSLPPNTVAGVSVHGLSQMLRRRRSANGALNGGSAQNSPVDAAPSALANRQANAPFVNPNPNARAHRIRLVPHLDSSRSLHFEPICRDVREGDMALRIGRFTDRSGMGVAALNAQNTNKLAFKSKVVSRAHAEIWCEPGGKFFIKDTKSSSGTFLNHVRLSAPNTDSRVFPVKDGDVLQLGVDYQGGTEEIYKCVKMRIELGREWQTQPNAFNTNALKQLKALSGQPTPLAKGTSAKSGISDCCICLFSVTVHQSLFIAPCSHVFHYKCIRPMLLMHHPGFSCPLCRTFANLEEDVEIDLEEMDTDIIGGIRTNGPGGEGTTPSGTNMTGRDVMDVDAMLNVSAVLNAANEVAAQMNGGGGAETEVERDFAPPNLRRRNGDGAGTLRDHSGSQTPSPARNGHFEDVLEDADEYALAETEDEGLEVDHDLDDGDDLHPLPALPVPTPNGPLPVPSSSSSAPSQMQGFAIPRPMSVPVSTLHRRGLGMVIDDASDGDDEFVGIEGEHEGDASGSSGEGPLGGVGAGEKRKR